jgi:hypothetical protein
MPNNQIKKYYPQNKKTNIVVETCFLSPKKEKHMCVGVLINESEESVRIGFNAKDEKLVDFLDISNKNIVDIRELSKKEIIKLK